MIFNSSFNAGNSKDAVTTKNGANIEIPELFGSGPHVIEVTEDLMGPDFEASAGSISYDGTTSKLTATNVQDAIDALATREANGTSSASDISYDNTTTDLNFTATTVQGAIDEVATFAADLSTDIESKQAKITGNENDVVVIGADGNPVAKTLTDAGIPTSSGGVGKSVEGVKQLVDDGAGNGAPTAGAVGAEIFNDYRERTNLTDKFGNIATGQYSHAEGTCTNATGNFSHAEGYGATASGPISHAEGCKTSATASYTHVEGNATQATDIGAHAEGSASKAYGFASHAEGMGAIAEGDYAHAEGWGTIANRGWSHAQGRYNKEMEIGDTMVIGNGADANSRSNCFRITSNGAVYGLSAFNSSGADYAEYFEWWDGNANEEDRVGYFVTMAGDKIRKAKPGDYILGIVSGQPCIIGNADEDWLGRWQHDDFGRFVKEYLEEYEIEVDNPANMSQEKKQELIGDKDVIERDGKFYVKEVTVVDYETDSWRFKANPEYDNTQQYIERKDRPEWSAVGMVGVLAVRDDGTCKTNGYCNVAKGGIATYCENEYSIVDGKVIKGYRVIGRVSENIIKVIFR